MQTTRVGEQNRTERQQTSAFGSVSAVSLSLSSCVVVVVPPSLVVLGCCVPLALMSAEVVFACPFPCCPVEDVLSPSPSLSPCNTAGDIEICKYRAYVGSTQAQTRARAYLMMFYNLRSLCGNRQAACSSGEEKAEIVRLAY